MGCDMCGSEGELVDAIVEGTMLKVCNRCSRFGNVITVSQYIPSPVEEPSNGEDDIEVIVNNYDKVVKEARERKGLKQDELAKDVGEKMSVIQQVESKHLKPSFKLAKKLEVYLRIKLIEKAEKVDIKRDKKDIDFKDKSLTIGDLLRK